MKRKLIKVSLFCCTILLLSTTGIFASVGWLNKGWSGANWAYKACNSKTEVFREPRYSMISATAKIGNSRDKKVKFNPSVNSFVHAVANGSYSDVCETWGNALK